MRYALIGDLHGNAVATETLEKELKRKEIDKIICLGDFIGKGPSNAYTVDWTFANCDYIIGGNWEYTILSKIFPADKVYHDQLGNARLKKIENLPKELTFTLSGQRIRCIHGRPIMKKMLTIQNDKDEFRPLFTNENNEKVDILCYADTHRQGLRTFSFGMVINSGSVGNALGIPKVCYCILNGENSKDISAIDFTFCQAPYDNNLAIEHALVTPEINHIHCYINEIKTGKYSRKYLK